METRIATIKDWVQLELFFKNIYREGHPLHKKEFWIWQYGDEQFGRSFISLNDKGEITGHVGANFGGGLAWMINVFLTEECRGQGILTRLYELARKFYPLAATAANEAGLGLYRNMRWFRYHDLVRVVKINPNLKSSSTLDICSKIEFKKSIENKPIGHYFNQPGIDAISISDGNNAIIQSNVGGLRIVDVEDLSSLENFAWDNNFKWMDYITSWNDLKLKSLYKSDWKNDYSSVVPWRLNPIVPDYFCDITYLSEEPVKKEFIVHRSYSDHGRVGSL